MKSGKLDKLRTSIPCLLLPIIVVTILLALESTHTNYFYFLYDDNAVQHLPYYAYNWRALIENGTLPFINFHQYLGYPYIGTGSSAVLYLPVYISAFLSKILTGDLYYTIDVIAFIHLPLASIGMFLLLRRLNIDMVICALVSLMWVTFPFIINVSRAWIFVSFTAAFLPFNFLFLDKLITFPRARNALYLSLIKSFFFFAGYIQYVFMTFVFEIFYLVIFYMLKAFSSSQVRKNRSQESPVPYYPSQIGTLKNLLKSYLLSGLFFVFLSAPLFIPMLFLQRESALRSTKVSLKMFLSWPIFWSDFFKAQIFDFKNVIFAGDSEIYYFGLVNIFLLFLIIFKRSRKDLRVFSFVLLAIIAFICSTELYRFFYYIPGFSLFRWPFKNFLFFLFFASIGVGGISNRITDLKTNWASHIRFAIYSIFFLSILVNIWVLWISSSSDHVFASMHIDNPPTIPQEKAISSRDGRILTLWVDEIEPGDRYKYLTYDFATLFGYSHLGGYDVLVSKINYRLALGLNHINSYRKILDRKLLAYLSLMSVRYLVTHDDIDTRRLEEFDQLRLSYDQNNILVYENTKALPLVYYPNKPWYPVEFKFDINEINIYPDDNAEADVAVNVAPLRWFRVYADGVYVDGIKRDKYPIRIKVPAGTKKLTIKYVDYPFYAGLVAFVIFCATLAAYGLYICFRKSPGSGMNK